MVEPQEQFQKRTQMMMEMVLMQASLQLQEPDAVLRAALTLAVVVCLQTAMMLAWLGVRDPGEIARVWAARRVAVWVGLTSMGGSFCWFLAFTLQNAAYVKALGQVELLLSLLALILAL